MEIKNVKVFEDANGEKKFSCEIIEDGKKKTVELPQFTKVSGEYKYNPEVIALKEAIVKQEIISKLDEKNKTVFKEIKPTEEKAAYVEPVNKNAIKRIVGKIALIGGIGLGSLAFGACLSGCGKETDLLPANEKTIEKEATITPDSKGKVEKISYAEAITDMKAIELEFEKYGIIDSVNKPEEAKRIIKGIHALYTRVNSSILPSDTLQSLYDNGFLAEDALQIVSDSLAATSTLSTYYENVYVTDTNDIFDASMFCKDELDKKVVSTVFGIAKENYRTADMNKIDKNMNVLFNYYQNLETDLLPYYGTSNSADALTHIGAHVAGLGAARNGFDGKKVEKMESLDSFGNFSKDLKELEKNCPWMQEIVLQSKSY